jgi:hypothetical protein
VDGVAAGVELDDAGVFVPATAEGVVAASPGWFVQAETKASERTIERVIVVLGMCLSSFMAG